MQFGVNYTPSQGWFYGWLDLDLDAITRDLEAIRAVGMDHVRMFPMWPILQPNRGYIRESAVQDVVRVARRAGEVGLHVSVDMLQGHMSSYDFLPNWVTDWHGRNIFSDPDVISGQTALITTLTEALKDVPGMTGINVGNEIVQFAASRHPSQHLITPNQARQWLTGHFETINAIWPDGTHTHSFDDDLFFEDDQPFLPWHATELGDMTTVHSWVFGKVGQRYGANHPALPWFARYICELAQAWTATNTPATPAPATNAQATRRPLWLQEVGAPLTYIDEDLAPAFLEQTITHLLEPALPNLTAITWWCSHDVNPSLLDFPSVEYSLGLFDTHGDLKPTGQAYQRMIERYSDVPTITSWNQPAAPEISSDSTPSSGEDGSYQRGPELSIELQRDGANRSVTSPCGDLFAQWYAHQSQGEQPTLRIHQV